MILLFKFGWKSYSKYYREACHRWADFEKAYIATQTENVTNG